MEQNRHGLVIMNNHQITKILLMKAMFPCIAVFMFMFLMAGRQAFAAPSDFDIDENGVLKSYTGSDSVIEIPSGVKEIGASVFFENETVTKVIIPSGVTNIQSCAFYNCTNLVSVSIPDSVNTISNHAFDGCKSLVYVKLPANLEKIEDYGFRDCQGLTEIVMPDMVKTLGNNVFDGCSGLVSVRLSSSLENWGFTIFRNADNLLYVTIPEGVTKIGEQAFYGCDGLIGVSLPSTLKEIEKDAFWTCFSLMNVRIPEGVEAIGDSAFYGCTSLYALQIPKTVTSIGTDIVNSSRLQAVYYTGSKTQWDQIATNGSKDYLETKLVINGAIPASELYAPAIPTGFSEISNKTSDGSDGFVIIDGILVKYTGSAENVTIPSGVTYIGQKAFMNNAAVKKVTIPDGVFGIGKSAFSGCKGLQEVVIPDSVVVIGDYAFNECTALTAADLPDSLFQVNGYAFYRCTALREIAFPAGLLSIGQQVFYATAIQELDLTQTDLLNVMEQAFRFCTQLKSASFPDSVISLGGYTFGGNSALQKVVLPSHLKNLKVGCFTSCTKLSDITIPADIKVIENTLFSYCNGLGRIRIPEGVENIGSYAFTNAGIVEISLPSTLKEISEGAIDHCRSLKAVILPENLEKVGEEAFKSCSNLSYIYLPESLSDIGENAFQSCDKISDVYYGGTDAKWQALGGNAIFPDAEEITLNCNSDPATLQQQFAVYRIIYELNGGTGQNPASYTSMDEDIKIGKPGKSGYYFVGWLRGDLDGGEPQREVTIPKGSKGDRYYIAVWTKVYSITYKDGEDPLSTSNPKTYTKLDGKIKLTDPERSGFVFLGWTGSNGTTPEKNLEFDAAEGGDRIYVANWKDYYRISYELDGGTVSGTNPEFYTEDDEDIHIVNPVKGDTKFLGWIGSDIKGGPAVELVIPKGSMGNRMYIAVWEGGIFDKESYIISYNLNGGTAEGNPTSYTSNDPDIVIKRPYKEDYIFIGWMTVLPVGGTMMDPIIYHGSRGDLMFIAMFEKCYHEEMIIEPEVKPTCTQDGRTEGRHCGCGKVNILGEVIPALGHHYDNGVVTKQPTATEKGLRTITCQRCGDSYTEQLPALGQQGSGSGKSGDGSGTGQPGTGDGTDGQSALKKGDIFKTKQGAFKVTKTGKTPEVSYLAPASAKKKSATIPATVKKNGVTYMVTSIAANAFAKNKKLKKVTIGKNIRTIGKKAFFKCKNLKTITVKTKVLKKVGKYAFKGIHKKAAFKFPTNKGKKYRKLLKKSGSDLPKI